MIAIVLADQNWGIAKNGDQILYIKDDLERFQQMTMGHTVIFGRKTLEKFPEGKPLKGRHNICLSKTLKSTDDMAVIHNLWEIEVEAERYITSFCIGGVSTYQKLFPFFTSVYVTRVLADLHADKFFPPLDQHEDFYMHHCWLKNEYDEESKLYYRQEVWMRKDSSRL